MWPIAIGTALLAGLLVALSSSANASVDAKLDALTPSRRRKGSGTPIFDYAIEAVPVTEILRNKRTGEKREHTAYRQRVVGAYVDGKRLTDGSPEQLTKLASQILGRNISVEAFALATLAASEASTQPSIAKVAVMHAALTKAKGKGNLLKTLAPDNRFGGQQGRYAATSQPPTFVNIELAESVLGGKVGNPTPGALYWDSPSGQRAALAKKIPGYQKTPEEVAEERHADHLVEVTPRGVDPEDLRLWKPATA